MRSALYVLAILLLLVSCRKEKVYPVFPINVKVELNQGGPWIFSGNNQLVTNDQIKIGIFSYEGAANFEEYEFNESTALYTKTTHDGIAYFELVPGNYYAVVLQYTYYKQAFQLKQGTQRPITVTVMD